MEQKFIFFYARLAEYGRRMRVPDYPSSDSALWSSVDKYLTDKLIPFDSVFETALKNNRKAKLPAHDVSAPQRVMTPFRSHRAMLAGRPSP